MSDQFFDTGNDPRLIFSINISQKAIKLLKSRKISELRRLNFEDRLGEIINLLNKIRYSYLSKNDLVSSETFRDLINLASKMYSSLMNMYKNLVKDNEFLIKWLRFTFRNILSLKDRLLSYPDDPSSSVEYCFVKVLSALKHPRSEKLWLTLVTDGKEKFDVITNVSSIKSNDVLLLAFLPPREFGGTVSEGMFLGPDGIRKGDESDIGSRPELMGSEKKKILAEIYSYIK